MLPENSLDLLETIKNPGRISFGTTFSDFLENTEFSHHPDSIALLVWLNLEFRYRPEFAEHSTYCRLGFFVREFSNYES